METDNVGGLHMRHTGGGVLCLYRGDEFVREIGVTPGWDFRDRDEVIVSFNNQRELCRAAPAGGEPVARLIRPAPLVAGTIQKFPTKSVATTVVPLEECLSLPPGEYLLYTRPGAPVGGDVERDAHHERLYALNSAPAGSGEVLTADAATLIRAKIHEWRTDALEIRESDHAHRNLIAEEYEAHADELEVLLAKKASPINGGAMVTDAMVAAAYDHLCGAGVIEDAGTVADDMKIMRAALEAALLRKLQQGAE